MLRQRIQAFMDPNASSQEAEHELAELRDRLRKLEAIRKDKRRVPRGIVVTRATPDGVALDEHPSADDYRMTFVKPGYDDAWCHVLDIDGKPIASYKPHTWAHVEHGRLEDIQEKAEAAKA